jgi:formamidopyrimidine-DNA glycosylase
MPELPEVETTRRGIAPLIEGRRVVGVITRQPRLRWPVPAVLAKRLTGNRIERVARRAKYLLLTIGGGTVIVHLGMSGSLRVLPTDTPAGAHDHVDILFDDHTCLRLRDPRRFGAVLWTDRPADAHALLAGLGPEPLGPEFTGAYLFRHTRARRRAIRDLLLDSRVVAGVGNIYANEGLFLAGIRPGRAAGRISRPACDRLVAALRDLLARAIEAGGTTLRDFQQADGRPGYFQQTLQVYGRAGAPCPRCASPIRKQALHQRTAYYCPHCQK